MHKYLSTCREFFHLKKIGSDVPASKLHAFSQLTYLKIGVGLTRGFRTETAPWTGMFALFSIASDLELIGVHFG
jgi:hypothetical protein